MPPGPLFWSAGGLLAGLAHVRSLWRATRPPFAKPTAGLRLLTTGAILAAAALNGGLLPAALMWTAGFSGGTVWLATRRRT